MLDNEAFFKEANSVLQTIIPANEQYRVLQQERCELEPGFLGFVDKYYALSMIIPKEATVIDFGCYLAAQSYFFKDHRDYIGVDEVTDMQRFQPPNATHYYGRIQDFFGYDCPVPYQFNNMEYFAICNYVTDSEACRMVRERFQNVFCFYPFSKRRNNEH